MGVIDNVVFTKSFNFRMLLSDRKPSVVPIIDKDSKNRRRLYTPPDFFETALRNAAGRSFSGLRLAFRAAPRPLRNCSCRRRKPGMSGRRESPRTAFRARRKSGRRPIPIIYIGEIIRPLFSQSGSGAVFVVVRAVSATPYRKTISPQTAQLSLLFVFLSVAHGARSRIKSIQ